MCKVILQKEKTLTALVNSLVFIGVTFQLANNILHVAVNPIILFFTGSVSVWSLSKLLTENFLVLNSLVAGGVCPSCNSYNKVFLGDVLQCDSDTDESKIKSNNCKELVIIRRSNLRMPSLNPKKGVSLSSSSSS